MTKRNPKRERWMAEFEAAVVQLNPEFAGRIDWNFPIFAFFEGDSPSLAAAKFVKHQTPKGPAHPAGATVKP